MTRYRRGTLFAFAWIDDLRSILATRMFRFAAHRRNAGHNHSYKERIMSVTLFAPLLFAAAGYSLLYLLMGGGLGGAILIFIVAKMLGR